ncbi:MAG: tyrosine-type recombinase/integrase [Crenarchaeota archaeon]|nr:tyrosine-type recombinase/integrase [Thermoproteota archaeon]
MVEAEVQGKASASPGILGSSSVDVDTCHFRTDFDAETLSNEPQPNITMTIPADSHDVRSKTVQCPECNSFKVFRNGFADSNFDVKIQRYVCRSCGRRFSDSDDLKRAKRVADSYFPTLNLKTKGANTESSQVCVLKKDAKNLTLETPEKISVLQGEKQVARGIDLIIKDFQWQLKIEGKVDVTIRNYGYSLLRLSKLGVDLFNPESFKEGMAFNDTLKKMTPIRRHGLTKAYKSFLAHNGIKADIPKIKFKRKTPYIPPKEHQDQLFSHCSHQMAAFCFTMQATGARPIEALRIEWNDIDKPHKRININHPAKGGNSRSIPVSEQLIEMLLALPHLNGKLVFTYGTTDNAGTVFRRMRRRAVRQFGNPELKKISFYSCRYWGATKERHAKGNPDAVQYLLGHSSLAYIQIYVQLAAQCFGDQEYDVIEVRDAQTLREVGRKGYEKYGELNGVLYYRKPKTD